MEESPHCLSGTQPCLDELLMRDSNEGPLVVRRPNRTEGDDVSKEKDVGFMLTITVTKSLSVIAQNEVSHSGQDHLHKGLKEIALFTKLLKYFTIIVRK